MKMSRRKFIETVTKAGAGIALAGAASSKASAVTPKKSPDDINIALIGAGAEGTVLKDALLYIPGIRFKAVCDIWEYVRTPMVRRLKLYKHDVNGYEDYREMLAQEKNLDAAIIATPDWMHAEHSNACMNAGLHVYCEKEMSNSLKEARSMLETSRKTGKLLQIGHQRGSFAPTTE